MFRPLIDCSYGERCRGNCPFRHEHGYRNWCQNFLRGKCFDESCRYFHPSGILHRDEYFSRFTSKHSKALIFAYAQVGGILFVDGEKKYLGLKVDEDGCESRNQLSFFCGKRDSKDKDIYATAAREFLEETGQSQDLQLDLVALLVNKSTNWLHCDGGAILFIVPNEVQFTATFEKNKEMTEAVWYPNPQTQQKVSKFVAEVKNNFDV